MLFLLSAQCSVLYLYQNSFQENQTDLEVILDFLEEYYRQNTGGDPRGKVDEVYWTRHLPADETSPEQPWTGCEPPRTKPALQQVLAHDAPPTPNQNTATLSEHGSLPNFVPARQSSKRHTTAAGGRKVRLFHFLFEMLEDPGMAHCVSWVPAATGVFRFSSRNKDQVAALWGQRKGNKRPMTYQKMSRALRNYARSGEIFKVKKKLTYQFSQDTLMSLQRCHRGNV
ncbi:transcription factor Spi-B-like [Myripristis murdjan]|uniref:transcription factor Spi-B-like n=1 Tax=Myripristis murdjan TaxID=586833 RepID=UPI001175F158|nr:transcription factor Spi-B-like [Myripristis murdjan]